MNFGTNWWLKKESGRMHRIIYKNGRFAKKSGSPVSQLAHACCNTAVNTRTVLRACVIILKAEGFVLVLDQTLISNVILLTIVLLFFFSNELTFARIVFNSYFLFLLIRGFCVSKIFYLINSFKVYKAQCCRYHEISM